MDRKYREKIKSEIKVKETEVDNALMFEENIRLSAEKLMALLPNTVNKAKLTGQLYSGKAFDTLIALMEDEEIPPEIRRKCANDILARGYGLPEQVVKSVNIEGSIEIPPEAFQATDLSIEANKYIQSGIPSSEWPDEIKTYFGIK